MTVARIASRAVFAFSSALLVIALCDLWQWFWHAHIRTWHLSLQGLVLLTLMVSLGVVTWKAMRAAREFAETNGQNGLVVYSGYGHLAAACVPTAMVLFISDEGWLLGYNAVLAMALIVCGWQAARYNRGLQVVRSLLVQIVFPFLFVFLGMFAAVHASSEENRPQACRFHSSRSANIFVVRTLACFQANRALRERKFPGHCLPLVRRSSQFPSCINRYKACRR